MLKGLFSMSAKPKVIIITGPTASGKSSLALNLATKLDGEIISADSMQVYRKLDIGTAKPTREEQNLIPHHLPDICEPGERFTVAAYLRLARVAIRDIQARGKQVIICGGTGLYIKGLVEGMDFDVEDDDEDLSIRNRLQARMALEGRQALYDELCRLDPEAALATHPNNEVRVIRALEIIYQTGQPATAFRREVAKGARSNEFDFSVYLPAYERTVLYRRINIRVDQMIEEGLADEARYLLDLRLDSDATALQAIGYKELFPYLRGEESLGESVERLKMATRRYAKRQLTWFRPLAWVQAIDGEVESELNVNRIISQNQIF